MNALRYHALRDRSNAGWLHFGLGKLLKINSFRATVRPMAQKFRCNICDLEEDRCLCDKYCWLCQGSNNVRLCQDGQYYCLECREACDLEAQIETT